MQNPFRYGGIVRKEAFCNRKQELADITRAIENGDTLFVFSERRMGKTSLVQLAAQGLSRRRYIPVYVDLWPTDGEFLFATTVARAIARATTTQAGRLLETARQLFATLVPSVTIDQQGAPQVVFGATRLAEPAASLEEVLAAPAAIAAQRDRQVVLVLDEFQQTLTYESDRVLRCLRSVLQSQDRVSTILLGSRKHLIQSMVLDRSAPLYRAGGHYPLGPIEEKHWQAFIRSRFKSAGKAIGAERVRALCALTEGHPFYTQHLCHALWELCPPGDAVTEEHVETAVDLLLDREQHAYVALWESLTANQRRLLRGIASAVAIQQPFSADFLQAHRLRSASVVQRALGPLLKRDLVDRTETGYVLTDRFFRIWISRRMAPATAE
jgi:type II secretory pathway predicted ATPase ExeA